MRISKAWIIATKDMRVFLRKRYAVYSLVLFPLIVGIGLPLVLRFAGARRGGISSAQLPIIMNAFSFFFLIGAAMLPTLLASYSLVGEKIEKSLEPLLAAPITDSELLLGKSIAAFIPPVGAIYISSIVFMALANIVTHNTAFFGANRPAFRSKVGHRFGVNRPPLQGRRWTTRRHRITQEVIHAQQEVVHAQDQRGSTVKI